MVNLSNTGTIFNIQRFSIHDGPGIRTTVFMKGCNLHCFWCHNPESVSAKPQIQYFENKCIGCRSCTICPQSAHTFNDSMHIFNRSLCTGCGKCAEICYSEALILTGKEYKTNEVFNEIIKDKPFYSDGGGVTFSGGEPLLQAEFVSAVAKMCREAGISVAVDTAGCVGYKAFEAVLPYTSLFLFDIKHSYFERHKNYTGGDNRIIKENLRRLLQSGADIWIRVPLIPDMNASYDDVINIAHLVADIQFSAGKKIKKFEFMPFHGIAEGKYISLGKNYIASGKKTIDKSVITEYYAIINPIINIETYT
jgi:glycyl-radical enzyme activating protein